MRGSQREYFYPITVTLVTINCSAKIKLLNPLTLGEVGTTINSMSYIRKKIVKGKEYWYLCKSVREGSRVRQIIIKYLGTKKPSLKEIEELKRRYR